ncbi:hypothetical protein GCM10007209_29310 [Haloferax sulfurifontis]|uniref:Uncharacterized protein n=1 Tax=Haloferax sulfurifontis TaxID=255616 RepID=A0A830DW66_9EURY|nr:hypothetical protein GCM10007209_29310 [Haloferax sulfurifontis]
MPHREAALSRHLKLVVMHSVFSLPSIVIKVRPDPNEVPRGETQNRETAAGPASNRRAGEVSRRPATNPDGRETAVPDRKRGTDGAWTVPPT